MDTLSWNRKEHLEKIIDVLDQELVVAGSSDTVFGLLAVISLKAFEGLNTAKGRFEKPYLVLISNAAKVAEFADPVEQVAVQKLMEQCWPGPLTLILKKSATTPAFVGSPEGAVALRVPNYAPFLELLDSYNGLFSTSANRTGQSVPSDVAQLDKELFKHVSLLVVDEDAKVAAQDSTILDCTGEDILVVREGAYSSAQLEAIAGVKFVHAKK